MKLLEYIETKIRAYEEDFKNPNHDRYYRNYIDGKRASLQYLLNAIALEQIEDIN